MWDHRCAKILNELLGEFRSENIRYFILCNYEGLPEVNIAKDVDVIVDPLCKNRAIELLKKVLVHNNITHTYLIKYNQGHCFYNINYKQQLALHIDLIFGYSPGGYILWSFDELYSQTVDYKNFRVLNELYDGLMVFMYKQFKYSRPELKTRYRELLYKIHNKYPEFAQTIREMIGGQLERKIVRELERQDFDAMLSYHKQVSSKLKYYSWIKYPSTTLCGLTKAYATLFKRDVLRFKSSSRTLGFIAPDGAGKSTVIDSLMSKLTFCFCASEKAGLCSLHHHRPTILPNLGLLKAKVTGAEQDTDFTSPHRGKPSGGLSSFFRMCYYYVDYLVGWYVLVFKDVHFGRITIFDRYIYDFVVDPARSSIKLPKSVLKLFVALAPKPQMVFYLDAEPSEVFARKRELSLEEIERQRGEYRELAKGNRRIILVDANRDVEQISDDILEQFLDNTAERLL